MISLAKAFDPSSAAAAELGPNTICFGKLGYLTRVIGIKCHTLGILKDSSVARSTDNIFRTGAGANQAFN